MELLCIQSHSQGAVRAGETYPLLAEKTYACCGDRAVDVGINGRNRLTECVCGEITDDGAVWWISSELFAPLATEDEVKEAEQKLILQES